MSNRADRRRQERALRHEKNMQAAAIAKGVPIMVSNPGQAERIDRMKRDIEIAKRVAKNGLTLKDVEEYYERGREEGFKQASHIMVRSYYSATVIAAKKLFGFGQTRLIRLLNEVERTIIQTMTDEELAKRAFMEAGVEVDPTEPFERAQFREKVKEWRKEKK